MCETRICDPHVAYYGLYGPVLWYYLYVAIPHQNEQGPPGYTLKGIYKTSADCVGARTYYLPHPSECVFDSPYWYLFVDLTK